jgi:hypothetical protein
MLLSNQGNTFRPSWQILAVKAGEACKCNDECPPPPPSNFTQHPKHLQGKGWGIQAILDDVCIMPKGDDRQFLDRLMQSQPIKGHSHFGKVAPLSSSPCRPRAFLL